MTHPDQCTEREPDGTWENCAECSVIMLVNAHAGRTLAPTTTAETTALRAASGKPQTGGNNYADLAVAIRARYGWQVAVTHSSFEPFWRSLVPGTGAAITGSMGAFTKGHHLRRWDPAFDDSHSVYVQRDDGQARAWWMNPEAPASYAGEYVTKNDVRKFFEGWDGAYIIAPVFRTLPDTDTEEASMQVSLTDRLAASIEFSKASHLWNVRTGATVDVPKGTRIAGFARVLYDKPGDPDNKGILVNWKGELHVAPVGVVDVQPLPPPAPTPKPYPVSVTIGGKTISASVTLP